MLIFLLVLAEGVGALLGSIGLVLLRGFALALGLSALGWIAFTQGRAPRPPALGG